MTRERLVEILHELDHGNINKGDTADLILTELAKEKPTREELLTILNAWHRVFGTTQLSHASARLEAAENRVKRLEGIAKEKEAPAGLIAELREWIKNAKWNGYGSETGINKVTEILSRYDKEANNG